MTPPPSTRAESLQLHQLPVRLQKMIRLILTHHALLCAHPVGTLELHFRHDSVKPKIICNPEE
jgi:hypothetical protein